MTMTMLSSTAVRLCLLSLVGVQGFHVGTLNLHQKSPKVQHEVSKCSSSRISPDNVLGSLNGQSQRRRLSSSVLHAVNGNNNDDNTNDYDEVADVLVIGSGPAARAIASLLAAANKKKLDVIVADKNFDKTWPPNYGVWQDEWQAVLDRYSAAGVNIEGGKVGNAIDTAWDVTDCYFGGSFDVPTEARMRLDRPYFRVDRNALQESLTPTNGSTSYKVLRANHKSRAIGVNLYEPAGSLVHDSEGTTVQLETADKKTLTVRSKLVVDCTGHETELVLRESRNSADRPPGFQIAYGCLVDVDETNVPDQTQVGPYAKEAMTLFDYRTDHYDASSEGTQDKVASAPTFMYAMPLGGNQIFFEETSLVGRPAISFQECKDRCFQRLEHHGIKVTKLHEEEFCYIPMGGALPAKDQRVLALGGAAAMVHPATGYHLCRCMMGAADMADAIVQELSSSSSSSSSSKPNLDLVAAAAYHSIWSPDNIRQRNFAVFGGEFLMKQNVVGLRGFFDGFFRLPLPLWAGFLAGWPGLPNNDKHETWFNRMIYGVRFISLLPLQVALDMAANIAQYTIEEGVPLPQSVTPFLGEPDSYKYQPNKDRIGDVAAKKEARKMITASKVETDLPVAFGEEEKQKVVVEKEMASIS